MDVGAPPASPDASFASGREEMQVLRARLRALELELHLRDATQAVVIDPSLLATARGLHAATGRTFFKALLEHLSAALDADFAFIGERVRDRVNLARTTVLYVDGREAPNIEYELTGTPCDQVYASDVCVQPRDVQTRFPDDALLMQMGVVGYAGAPLFAADGALLGIMAVMSRRPIEDPAHTERTLRLFAMRAAAELERLQAEEKLQRSETLLRNILDHTTAVISVKSLDGRYLLANRQFERIFQIPFERLVDHTCHEIIPREEADRVRANDLEVQQSRGAVQREEVVTLPNGERHTFLAVKVPLFDVEGSLTATCAISTDITEHNRLEAQIMRARRMESIGQLAGGVAHDFNNLLTAIGGYVSLTMESLPQGHPSHHDMVEAQKACQRAAALTARLLAFARKQVIQPRAVDVAALLSDLQGLLRPVLGERVRVRKHLAPGLWSAHVDPGQLEQVLMNLAVNARDAMPDGGDLDIHAANVALTGPRGTGGRELPPGDYVEIRVTDTGHGIPESIRPHLFEPFFTTKPAGKGTGLGLATCYGIVVQSAGSIEFESRVGEGTSFTVLIPRAASTPVPAAVEHNRPASHNCETVLVVEDEPLVRELVVRSLRRDGFTVLEAEAGEEALRVAKSHEGMIDLLLSDVVMPGMNGPELATRLRALRPGTRVLLTSGYADSGVPGGAEEVTAWPLLQKPYTPLELSSRVRELLDAATA